MSKETAKRFLLFAAAGLVVAAVLYVALSPKKPPSMVGSPLPQFSLPDLSQAEVPSTDLVGQPLLLCFWEHESTACDREMAALEELQQEKKAEGLRVVGINCNSTVQAAQAYARDHGITFKMLHTAGSFEVGEAVGAMFHLAEVPRIILVDVNGVIRGDLRGYQKPDELRAALEKSQIMTIPLERSDVVPEGEGGESVQVEGAADAAKE